MNDTKSLSETLEKQLKLRRQKVCKTNFSKSFGLSRVPLAILPDNLKAAVTKADRYEPQLNDIFQDFGTHYGTSILPARAYKPRDKALVEGAVRIVYSRIFAPLREDLYQPSQS